MRICKQTLDTAFQSLSATEQDRAFSSVSQQDAHTAVTKFSTSLVALLASKLPAAMSGPPWVVRCAFKGNKSGRSGGSSGGLTDLSNHAATAFSKHGVQLVGSECLLDFVVYGIDILDVAMTVESEATPIALDDDLYDVDKLLLVSSPRRVFVGRVNVTKTGKTHKLDSAKLRMRARFDRALKCGHILPGETFDAVLLETRSDGEMAVHVAEFSISSEWQRVLLDRSALPTETVSSGAAPPAVDEPGTTTEADGASVCEPKASSWFWSATFVVVTIGLLYLALFG